MTDKTMCFAIFIQPSLCVRPVQYMHAQHARTHTHCHISLYAHTSYTPYFSFSKCSQPAHWKKTPLLQFCVYALRDLCQWNPGVKVRRWSSYRKNGITAVSRICRVLKTKIHKWIGHLQNHSELFWGFLAQDKLLGVTCVESKPTIFWSFEKPTEHHPPPPRWHTISNSTSTPSVVAAYFTTFPALSVKHPYVMPQPSAAVVVVVVPVVDVVDEFDVDPEGGRRTSIFSVDTDGEWSCLLLEFVPIVWRESKPCIGFRSQ